MLAVAIGLPARPSRRSIRRGTDSYAYQNQVTFSTRLSCTRRTIQQRRISRLGPRPHTVSTARQPRRQLLPRNEPPFVLCDSGPISLCQAQTRCVPFCARHSSLNAHTEPVPTWSVRSQQFPDARYLFFRDTLRFEERLRAAVLRAHEFDEPRHTVRRGGESGAQFLFRALDLPPARTQVGDQPVDRGFAQAVFVRDVLSSQPTASASRGTRPVLAACRGRAAGSSLIREQAESDRQTVAAIRDVQ